MNKIGCLLSGVLVGVLFMTAVPLRAEIHKPAPKDERIIFSFDKHNRAAVAAPPFQMKDVLTHKKIMLKKYKGKVVVLMFFATWSFLSQELAVSLIDLQKQYQAKGVRVLAIALDEDEGAIINFCRERNINFPVMRAESGPGVVESYAKAKGDIHMVPTTYLIDRSLMIQYHFSGNPGRYFFEEKLKKVINQ